MPSHYSDVTARLQWRLREKFFTTAACRQESPLTFTLQLHSATNHLPFSAVVLINCRLSSNLTQSQLGGGCRRRRSCFLSLDGRLLRKWTEKLRRKWKTESLLLGFHWKFLADTVGEPVFCWLGSENRLTQRDKLQKTKLHFIKTLRWLSSFMLCPPLQEKKPLNRFWPQSEKPHTLATLFTH